VHGGLRGANRAAGPPGRAAGPSQFEGAERTIIVSDASSLAGLPAGEYEQDGRTVVVTPEGMIRLPSQKKTAVR
jgi:N-acetylglucosamine-6-phosphate deacetylase